ncbi:crossover junction endodeoxyribonuclease RuvC [Chitinispirillales bacterium ANBcel5]|uniref:crossover junction endodeoxyribonuclease RuvC n=1 Tax=Cellulosispirillum alkaliphilum TaxID=3039283 RepID=UPI002A4F72F1|nr:crossover junction endodeoxyribonuclease RuvC [Chitinispirillales bacterium ANBcel5]
MVIFGVDPGTMATGYGVIKVDSNRVSWIDSGAITPDSAASLWLRLECIYDGLWEKMNQHSPDFVCIEQAFYGKNVHTTLVLGHARGVAMLAAAKSGASVREYTPREIKKTVTGNGNAKKEQVQYMVNMLLSPPHKHMRSDAYDALAVALCDFQCSKQLFALKTTR